MSYPVKVIGALRNARRKRLRAEKARRESIRELRARVREAHEAGVPVTLIAAEAGLSRQGVYDVLAAEPPA